MNIIDIEEKVVAILKRHGAEKIGIFGSYARGEAVEGSDLDLLVRFCEQKSLMTLVRIERELSESTGLPVDLLTEKAVSPYLINRIVAEEKVIYQ